MAKASAWLAIAFGLYVISYQAYLIRSFGVSDLFPVPEVAYGLSPGVLLVVGGCVVLKRLKPGLRLLCTAWSFVVGQSLLLSAQIYQTHKLAERMALEENDAVAATLAEPGLLTFISGELVTLSICICGLGLALLARRPHHKG